MSTHPVYDQLLAEITEENERKVLTTLIERAGERVTRPELVKAVFGVYISQKELSASIEDRKVRECIEHLQARDYPIVSSSGQAGYILAADNETTDAYIAEIGSRIKNMQDKEAALRRSKRWIPFIREWRAGRPATQGRLL